MEAVRSAAPREDLHDRSCPYASIVPTARATPAPTTARAATYSAEPRQPSPHQQLTQTAPIGLQEELFVRVQTLPGVSTGDSCVSVPGAAGASILDPALAAGPAAAFQCATESAHLHPPGHGSLHIALPPLDLYQAVQAAGWATHPISGTMLSSRRDEREPDRLADRARVDRFALVHAGHRAGNTYRRRFLERSRARGIVHATGPTTAGPRP